MKIIRVYKYKGIEYSDSNELDYPSTFCLIRLLEDEEKVVSILDYGRTDRLVEYYCLLEDYESGFVAYQIEDWTEFFDRFADKLGIEILESRNEKDFRK
mgnify:CR=1 FL=1